MDRRRVPPDCPPGWTPGPPDYIGLGVPRSGTTWWWWLIRRHPHVAAPGPVKELDFVQLLAGRDLEDSDIETYHQFFPRPPGQAVGEWSTSYADLDRLELLDRLAPRARFLLLLRDPVDRYVSDMTMRISLRIGDAHSPDAGKVVAERGMYASTLERIRTSLSHHPLLVLQYERCVQDPAGELARTYRFLGLDDGFRPSRLRHRMNRTYGDPYSMSRSERRRLLAMYMPEVERLAGVMPELDLDLWPNFAAMTRGVGPPSLPRV